MSSVGGSPMAATFSTPPMRGVSCAAAPVVASMSTTVESRMVFIARLLAEGGADDTIRRRGASVLNVLVTMPFGEARLQRLRAVSSAIAVAVADPARAEYVHTDVLYAGDPPRDLSRAPRPKWVPVPMAGGTARDEPPLDTQTHIPTT